MPLIRASPCDLLLQLGHTRYVEHDSKVNGGLQPMLVQLLFQRFLQVYPPLLVLLVEVPQTEVCYLRSNESKQRCYALNTNCDQRKGNLKKERK